VYFDGGNGPARHYRRADEDVQRDVALPARGAHRAYNALNSIVWVARI
jgi:hypothetical protein